MRWLGLTAALLLASGCIWYSDFCEDDLEDCLEECREPCRSSDREVCESERRYCEWGCDDQYSECLDEVYDDDDD